MTIILTKDCLGIISNYLYIKDAIKIALLNKEYNKIWQHIKYEHIVEYQDLGEYLKLAASTNYIYSLVQKSQFSESVHKNIVVKLCIIKYLTVRLEQNCCSPVFC